MPRKPRSDESIRKAKAKHERKKKQIEQSRTKARQQFLEMEFEAQVQEVINYINELEPAKGCTKNFLNRNSFEFIRCGFQKFILDYGLTDYIKYPKTLDELKGR